MTPEIFESEYNLCLIIWKEEPISTSELVKIAKEKLKWQRTTTYTVVKRLCERNIMQNNNGIVTSLISKKEAQISRVDQMIDKTFEGSLPSFINAFVSSRKINADELKEIEEMIESMKKEK
ncbi:MAG: BlaI/MecI/CopY family transcriptional regulator [Solobacterium sp.]|nr:BlaI/MecI/CopY family transcriptional regulator [Solobacterium sp.]MDD6956609.1 BlaI/MecI/CopY family transcriptional regulator [Solobacterium sp.]MDY5653489.1 BlaI/MecI/CopY family transcriptional regulator [Erysipelotrichaceae bacterium]